MRDRGMQEATEGLRERAIPPSIEWTGGNEGGAGWRRVWRAVAAIASFPLSPYPFNQRPAWPQHHLSHGSTRGRRRLQKVGARARRESGVRGAQLVVAPLQRAAVLGVRGAQPAPVAEEPVARSPAYCEVNVTSPVAGRPLKSTSFYRIPSSPDGAAVGYLGGYPSGPGSFDPARRRRSRRLRRPLFTRPAPGPRFQPGDALAVSRADAALVGRQPCGPRCFRPPPLGPGPPPTSGPGPPLGPGPPPRAGP
jgi:hypothetical protein